MSRKMLAASAVLLVAAIVFALAPASPVLSSDRPEVFVVNFPDPQNVRGTVAVEGPIRSAELKAVGEIIVSPVQRADTTRWVAAGTLVTDGYPYAVLSLAGQVRGKAGRSGDVGAILIPDEEQTSRAFNEQGRLMFPLEVIAPAEVGGSPFVASRPAREALAFPRYQVYLYNTTDKAVAVTLYAYLTSG